MSQGMEALLLGGDSSDDDSDNEQKKQQQQQPKPVVAAAPPATSPAAPAPTTNASPSEMSQRLKSLYSSSAAAKHKATPSPQQQQQQSKPMQPPASVAPSHQHRPRTQHPPTHSSRPLPHQQPHQPSQQQRQHHQQQQQQRHSASTMGHPLGSTGSHRSSGSTGNPLSRGGQPMASPPQQQQQQQQPPPPSSQSLGGRPVADPFAPTPVSKIMEQHVQHQQHQPQNQHQQQQQQQMYHRSSSGSASNHHRHHPGAPATTAPSGPSNAYSEQQRRQQYMSHRSGSAGSSSSTTGVAASSSTSMTPQQRDLQQRKNQKEKEAFLLFVRVLVKYLQTKDPDMHRQVTRIIKDCTERNKRREPGYESATNSMKSQLRKVVSEAHWKRAELYMKQLFEQKRKLAREKAAAAVGAASSSSAAPQRPAVVGGGSGSSSSSSSTREQEQRQAMLRMHQERQAAVAAAKNVAPLPSSANQRTISSMRKDIAAKREALEQQGSHKPLSSAPVAASSQPIQQQQQQQDSPFKHASLSSAPSSATKKSTTKRASPATSTSSGKGKSGSTSKGRKQQQQQQQPSTVSPVPPSGTMESPLTVNLTATSQPVVAEPKMEPVPPAVVKEYSEFLQSVDTVTNIHDWTSTALFLGETTRATLAQEQMQLLYESSGLPRPSATANIAKENSFPRPGWDQRNLVGTRVAWSKVRLRELETHKTRQALQQQPYGSNLSSLLPFPQGEYPVVAGGLLSLPTVIVPSKDINEAVSEDPVPAVLKWINEKEAESDTVLAAISAATQIYLKQVLEKAVHCARQRENVDGIRLWHQQVTPLPDKESSSNNKKAAPLFLRLGCNVKQKVAESMCAAALTVKQMEESLEKQQQQYEASGEMADNTNSNNKLTDQVLQTMSGMEEAACFERLGSISVQEAENQVKRSRQEADEADGEAPLGRVAKKVKLQVVDFQLGMNLGAIGSFGRHKAFATGASFSF